MKLVSLSALIAFSLLLAGCLQAQPGQFPTPFPTDRPTVTPTVVPTVSATVTLAPTLRPTATLVPKSEFVAECNAETSASERENCLQTAAVAYEDASLCEQQSSTDDRLLCRALTLDEPSGCKNIRDEPKRADCYNGLALAQENATLCTQIPANQSLERLDCLLNVAFRTGSSTICTTYLTGAVSEDQALCKALAAKNPALCNSIADVERKETCLLNLALALQDASPCASLVDPASVLACQIRVQQLSTAPGG